LDNAQNHPTVLTDSTGMLIDDYYARSDGSIIVFEQPQNDTTDHFYVERNGTYVNVANIQRNADGLTLFPASGTGFGRYGGVDPGGFDPATQENIGAGDHYVQPIVAAALFGMAEVLSGQNITMSFGDMSSSNGSDPGQPGGRHHAGHGHNGNRTGIDADFRYLDTNGAAFQSPTATTDAAFSQANNQTAYDTARTFGFTRNYQGTAGPNLGATRVGGHNDHGHLGFTRADAQITRHALVMNGNAKTWPSANANTLVIR
jgi:hypothetical protein